MKESAVVKQCTDLLKAYGIIHWRNSVLHGYFRGFKKKKSYVVKTGVSGLADWSFLMTDGSGRTVYMETKKPKGKQRDSQIEFETECIKLNVPYILIDDVNDLIEYLKIYGMIK